MDTSTYGPTKSRPSPSAAPPMTSSAMATGPSPRRSRRWTVRGSTAASRSAWRRSPSTSPRPTTSPARSIATASSASGSSPPAPRPEENIEGLRRNNLKGAKVHPLYQGYALDDPGLRATLDAMQGEFAVIIHVGEGDSPESNARCTPSMMRQLVLDFPRLDVIACHFGGYRLLDQAEEMIVGLPVYIDTSWPPGVGQIEPDRLRKIIERHGPERVVFASDWPMADPARDIETIRGLGLADADTAAILGGNLERLLLDG